MPLRLQPLFEPASVAIVGASPRSAYTRFLSLNLSRYQGDQWYVNPRHDTVNGRPCHPSLSSLPAVPEHVLVITPSAAAVDVVEEAAALGCRAVTVYSSGYAETSGPEGQELDRRLRRAVADGGMLLCGPNCMGIVTPATGYLAYSAPLLDSVRTGSVSVLAHSGGLLVHWLPAAGERGLGIRHAVSAGNEAGVTTPEYLEHFVADPETAVIVLLYLEAVGDDRRFVAALSAAQAAGKPVLIVKVGRTAAAAKGSLTHTGRLSPPAAEFAAAARSCGACFFETADEALEGALAFQASPVPAGGAAAVISASGALGNHMVDLIHETAAGLELAQLGPGTLERLDAAAPGWLRPSNPLDSAYPGQSDPPKYAELARLMTEDPAVQLLLAEGELDSVTGRMSRLHDEALLQGLKAAGKPVYFFSRVTSTPTPEAVERAQRFGLAYLQGTARAVRSVATVVRWHQARRRAAGPAARPEAWPCPGATRHDQLVGAFEAFGMRVAPGQTVPSAEAACSAAARLGWPVALKRLDIVHKTEQQAVELGLADADAVAMAYESLARLPGEPVFYVQKMVPGDWPLLFGGRASTFGPLVMVAVGGVFTEYLADSALRLGPVDEDQAADMLRELRGWPWLVRDRHGRSADIAWVASALAGFSRLVSSAVQTGTASIEANPVLVGTRGEGGWAVDLRAETA